VSNPWFPAVWSVLQIAIGACRPLFRPAAGRRGRRLALASAIILTTTPLVAQTTKSPSVVDLKRLTVEELMQMDVTSVSRTSEPLGGAPAAITVVTNEDIRRSGATSVPEALRFVPGIHVARQTSSTWALSSRGFSSVNSEKLLVLSDTRSVYTPLFSGVSWDVQDYLLQDIERIEVIRGPGATLWGSNAVNGVINITTKDAQDTQGLYVETSAGNEERVSVSARFGGQIGRGTYYRVFGKYLERDSTFAVDLTNSDDWNTGHAGFRIDRHAGMRDFVTVQGDIYRGTVGQLAPAVTVIGRPGPAGPLRVHVNGGNVLTRWRRNLSQDADVQLRVYYDRTDRDDPSFTDALDTLDSDFQHRLRVGSRQEVTWGANYRFAANENVGRGIFAVEPARSRDHLLSGFIQDQIRIFDSLRVTGGTKLEHNSFSGVEFQPSGRIAWDPSSSHTLWGAVSRAVRVPTRLERDVTIDVSDPNGNPVVRLLGNRAFDSERLLAVEAGYRWQPVQSLSVDLAVFDNRYRGLASLEVGEPFLDAAASRTIVPLRNENLTAGRARGVEALVTYSPLPPWRLSASYSHLHLHLDPEGADLNRGEFLEGSTPRNQLGVRSSLDLPARLQFDAQFRHVSSIRRMPPLVTGEGLPEYSELDVRLAWEPWRQLEVSLVGQNLLHNHHVEFGPPTGRGAIQRGAYAKVAWGF
jgi:iron complex outermembrane receptor protein